MITMSFILLACASAKPDISKEVVEIIVVYQNWDPRRPWVKTKPNNKGGFGVVIEGDRILTTEPIVADSTLIQVKKHGTSKKYPAKVAHSDQKIGLAVLTIDDYTFFEDVEPVVFDTKSRQSGEVVTARWKERQLEKVVGTISRVAVNDTGFFYSPTLSVNTDLSRGGLCEPVFIKDKLIGIVTRQSDRVAEVLPSSVLLNYINALEQTEYPGFSSLNFSWQVNRDPYLASYLGLEGEPRGVIIRETMYGTSSYGIIKPRDILLTLDGYELDADGYFSHPKYGTLRFKGIVSEHFAGETISATVFRDGQVLELSFPLINDQYEDQLIPWARSNYKPPFYIGGGFVFRELDYDYLSSFGNDWRSNINPRLSVAWDLERNSQNEELKRLVVLAYVIPDSYNLGYHGLRNIIVDEINGKKIGTVSDLPEAFSNPIGNYHVIKFRQGSELKEAILDAGSFEANTNKILHDYLIPTRFYFD